MTMRTLLLAALLLGACDDEAPADPEGGAPIDASLIDSTLAVPDGTLVQPLDCFVNPRRTWRSSTPAPTPRR
jgi:hypothetical protein